MTTQCVFVNTEQPPTKITRLGVFQYHTIVEDTVFHEMCEVFYPHPDAPEYVTVSVFRWLSVEIPPGTEALIKQTIDAMNAIGKITKLN